MSIRPILPTAVLLLAGLASAPLLAGTPINQLRPLDPGGKVEIENLKGSIEVRAWNRQEVKIEGSLGAGVEKLEIDGDSQRLRVKVRYPNRGGGLGLFAGGGKSEPSDLRLMVPLASDLQIDTVSASVDVSGVASNELSIDTVSGDVTVAAAPREARIDAVSGDLRLTLNRANIKAETVSGDIQLRGRLGADLGVETVSGSIDVIVLDTAVRRLSAESVSGGIHVETALAANGEARLKAVSGDVRLDLPRTVSASVKGQSFSGDLSAPGAEIMRTRHGPGSSFEHRYGDGSAEVSIETFSGDAELRLH